MDGSKQNWRRRAVTTMILLGAGGSLFSDCQITARDATMDAVRSFIVYGVMAPESEFSPFHFLVEDDETATEE